jgi:hypothetical protein
MIRACKKKGAIMLHFASVSLFSGFQVLSRILFTLFAALNDATIRLSERNEGVMKCLAYEADARP